MKKKPENENRMRDEYDFSKGVRGRYAERFAQGTNLVRLDPDLAGVFPDSESFNKALHAIAEIVRSR